MLTRKAMLRSQPACTYALLIDSHKKPKIWTESPIYPFHKMESQAGSPGLHSKKRMKKRVESIIGDQQSRSGVGWDMCLLGPTLNTVGVNTIPPQYMFKR